MLPGNAGKPLKTINLANRIRERNSGEIAYITHSEK
jgi:hypothetical protein